MAESHPSTNRRSFLQTLGAGAVIAPTSLMFTRGNTAAASEGTKPFTPPNLLKGEVIPTSGQLLEGQKRFIEAPREIPVAGHSDILIAGAGPAGVGAALAAARAGASVRVIECAGCVGGVWTAGMLTKIIDAGNKSGVMKEIMNDLVVRGSNVAKQTRGEVYDPELCKLILEEKFGQAGIKVQLHTQLVGAIKDQHNRVVAVITESKSGRQVWTAERFIDCSGDGDLAAQAGCGFDVGMTSNCECQPMTLMALLTGIKEEEVSEFIRERGAEAKSRFLKFMNASGINPSYRAPTLRHLHSGIYSIMTNHEYAVPAFDAAQISDATIRARAEIHAIVDALRNLGGPWSNLAVVATAEQIGIREGRRIHGRYTITAQDLVNGMKHPDGICKARFGFDVHNILEDGSNPPAIREAIKNRPKPYDIPLPSLIAKDVDGLMMAGRCISGDFLAHSSYRVTGNSVPMGEAAGLTCVASLKKSVMPHELSWSEVQQITGTDLKSTDSKETVSK